MLINMIRDAFRHSALSDLVLFLKVLWQTLLATYYTRPTPDETKPTERTALEQELTEIEDLLIMMDEEMEGNDLVISPMPELVLRRLESNPYCQALDEPAGAFIQNLRLKILYRKRAKEIEAELERSTN